MTIFHLIVTSYHHVVAPCEDFGNAASYILQLDYGSFPQGSACIFRDKPVTQLSDSHDGSWSPIFFALLVTCFGDSAEMVDRRAGDSNQHGLTEDYCRRYRIVSSCASSVNFGPRALPRRISNGSNTRRAGSAWNYCGSLSAFRPTVYDVHIQVHPETLGRRRRFSKDVFFFEGVN